MSLLSELGLRPVINANATLTKLGGSLMPPEVLAAMAEGARSFVPMAELSAAIGERIAKRTRNEAAVVLTGAAAGLTLCAAACVTRGDSAAIEQLPSDPGSRSELIMFEAHANPYDRNLRNSGARLLRVPGAPANDLQPLMDALSERTAAVLWFHGVMSGDADAVLGRLIAVCSERAVPVIVDAAAQLPPVENLWKFTALGATGVIFSGGKGLHGPQSTGLLLGKRWLIDAVRSMACPNQSFGRALKVGKEELFGILVAVERYLQLDHDAKRARDERIVAEWLARWNAVPGLTAERVFPNEANQPLPRVRLQVKGASGQALAALLFAGDPAISVAVEDTADMACTAILVNPWLLSDAEAEVVAEQVTLLAGHVCQS
jgi:L-seryl-tRNA(Ser) seleniumtransferase